MSEEAVKKRSPGAKNSARWPRVVIPISVSALLIFFLFRNVELNELIGHLRPVIYSGWFHLAFAVVVLANTVLQAEQWRLLLKALGYPILYRTIFLWNIAMDVFSAALPLRGGEVVRAWGLWKKCSIPPIEGGSSVAINLGLSFLSLIYLILFGWLARLTGSLGTGAVGIIFVILLAAILIPPLGRYIFILWREPASGDQSVSHRIYTILHNMSVLPFSTMSRLMLYSFLFQFTEVLRVALFLKAFSIEIGFAHLLSTVPLIMLVSALPFSVSGVGVRETSLIVAFLGVSGATTEQLLGVGLVYTFSESFMPFLIGFPFAIRLLAEAPRRKQPSAGFADRLP